MSIHYCISTLKFVSMTVAIMITTAVRPVIKKTTETEVTFLAASIAYYAFVGLIPLLLLSFVFTTVVIGEGFNDRLEGLIHAFLTPLGQEMVDDLLLNATTRGGVTVVSIGVLVWSGVKLFQGMNIAFSMVYGVRMEGSFLEKAVSTALVFIAVILAVIGMWIVGLLRLILPDLLFLKLMTPLTIFLPLLVVFLPLYYFLPEVPMTAQEAVPGAAVAAFGWTLLDSFFGVYAANAGQYGVYGVLGGVLLLASWLYIGAIVLVLGAVINAVFAEDEHPKSKKTTTINANTGNSGYQMNVLGARRECSCPTCGYGISEDLISGETVECWQCGTDLKIDFQIIPVNGRND